MNKLFHIFKVDFDEAIKIGNEPDEPHNHNFEELLIGVKGKLDHFIDYQSSTTPAPFISFVTKGKPHRLIPRPENDECEIWGIRFKSEFIPETTFQLYSIYHNQANLQLQNGSCFKRLVTICELMYEETQQETVDVGVIRQLLGVLLSMVETERRKLTPNEEQDNIKSQSITFKSFLKILEENYKRNLGVDFYAEKLFMSSRNLNLICQNILSQSVSEIIETRKLIEAKNMLVSTNKTIAEIAYEIGYNENSYFSNVFKKKSGQTPGEFRQEMQKMLIS